MHPGIPATSSSARLPGLDALRGLALLGVIVVNAGVVAAPAAGPPSPWGVWDEAAGWGVAAFAMGKAFLVFSALFGYGCAVLAARAEAGGGSYLRRQGVLAAIGAAHAALLFVGDILMLYALAGTLLWLVRRAPDRLLLVAAGGLYAAAVPMQTWLAGQASPDDAAAVAAYLGGPGAVLGQRLRDLPEGLAVVLLYNGPAALAMILVGFVACRRGWAGDLMDWSAAHPVAAAVLLAATAGASGAATVWAGVAPAPWLAIAAVFAIAPALSLSLSAVVLGHAGRVPASAATRLAAAVGRTSLTGYLLHSLLLGAVFHGWGLGWLGRLGWLGILLVALAVYAAIAILAVHLARRGRPGPAEILLRRLAGGGREDPPAAGRPGRAGCGPCAPSCSSPPPRS